MNTENRLWVDTKSARTRDSYLPPMCDAKLAESAETRKRSNSKRFGASPERCRIAQARSSAREGLLEEVRSPELMADCMQSFSSSQNIQSEMHNLDTNHTKKTTLTFQATQHTLQILVPRSKRAKMCGPVQIWIIHDYWRRPAASHVGLINSTEHSTCYTERIEYCG